MQRDGPGVRQRPHPRGALRRDDRHLRPSVEQALYLAFGDGPAANDDAPPSLYGEEDGIVLVCCRTLRHRSLSGPLSYTK